MKKSARMKPVRMLKQLEEKNLAKQFSQAQQEWQNESQQLTVLTNYRNDYLNSLKNPTGSGLNSAFQLEKYQLFILRLEKAIVAQQEVVVLKQQAVEAARLVWSQANAKLNVLDSLINKMKIEEDKFRAKQDQRMIDDLPKRRLD